MNRIVSRGAAVATVAVLFLLIGTATASASNISDIIPAGPDYSGVGFLSDPAKRFTGFVLALAQVFSLLIGVVCLLMVLFGNEDNQSRWQKRLKIAGIVFIASSFFNPLLTGGFGFLSAVVG